LYRTRRGTRRRLTPASTKHSTLSPYSPNPNFWRAPPLSSNHLYASMRFLAQFIAPIGRWLQEGVLIGERELQCPVRRCGHISGCGWPCDFHRLQSCISDLVPEAVRRWLWVGLLSKGGVAGSLGVASPGPLVIHSRSCSNV
jgi:hypothetical protein